LCDTEAIARHYGVTPSTIRRWACEDGWHPWGTRAQRLWNLREAQASYDHRRAARRMAEFLIARIVEQLPADLGALRRVAQRLLQCAADDELAPGLRWAVQALAAGYADHPAYDETWAG
jgi:hypothetical protein